LKVDNPIAPPHTLPRIVVLSRLEAEHFTADEPYAVVSFTNPGEGWTYLQHDPYRLATLRLQAKDEISFDKGTFRPVQALRLLLFVRRYLPRVSFFVFHCRAGVSRSRGAALGVSLALGLPAQDHLELGWPNALVVWRVLRAHKALTGEHFSLPTVMRDLVICSLHPGGYNPPRRDAQGDVIGFCKECGKDIPGETISLFDMWKERLPELFD
jgi:predicted protein tyrosine phosphatase